MSKNINTNTAIANIILSKDHEIRLKKKPKKKSSNKKKEALDKVRNILQEFDLAINAAKNANVKIPEALGKLPDNINQINSIKELNALALDLQNRIVQINQLVSQGASQKRTQGLFQEVRAPQPPTFFAPTQPQIQPQIIPNQQFPQQPIQPLTPPATQPISPTQEQEDDDTEKTLDKLQKEILDKLSPEDKAKAEAEFEKERQQRKKEFDEERAGDIRKPATDPSSPELTPPVKTPDEPTTPTTPTAKTDIVELKGLENPLTNQKFDLKAPRGFGTVYNEYKMLIKNLIADILKIDDKQFNLPKEKDRDIQKQQTVIIDNYDKWLSGLNKEQLEYNRSNPQLQQLENDIIRDMEIPPVQLLKEIAKGQKLDITITTGEASEAEKRESKVLSSMAENLVKVFPAVRTKTNRLLKDLGDQTFLGDNDAQLKKYDTAITQLNDTKATIEMQFNALEGTDKVGILTKYNKIMDGLQQAIVRVSKAKRTYVDNVKITPIDPINFDAPVKVDKPVDLPKPKPKPKLTPEQEKVEKLKEAFSKLPDPFTAIEAPGAGLPDDELDKKNVAILVDYYKTTGQGFKGKQQNAYLQLFGDDALSKIKVKKGRAPKLPIIKKAIQTKFPKYSDKQFMTIASM